MSLKHFSLIAAQCENRGIGVNNRLPWRLKNEMAFFTETTTKTVDDKKRNAVVMGRKTWDSIPTKFRPLEKRVNVVLSKTLTETPQGCDFLFSNFDELLATLSKKEYIENIFVIGGEAVYKEALKNEMCKNIYLTKIFANFDCDTFFPEFDENVFKEKQNPSAPQEIQEENNLKYKFCFYSR